MKASSATPYDRMLSYLRERKNTEPSLADVVNLAGLTAESMQAFCVAIDAAVYRELRDIASYIEKMKSEIGHFQVNDLKESRIPAAGQELDAVVQATETATNTIMEAAEALMAAEHTDIDEFRAFVTDKVMAIFEACSFQDITGQRVAKVVETLQMIETRVARFADAMNATDLAGAVTEHEKRRQKRAEDLLLNGPQLSGHGIDQKDVDRLLKGGGE